MKQKTKFFIVFIIIIIFDQLVKKVVVENHVYTINSGITLGFLEGFSAVPVILNLLLLILLSFLIKSGTFAKYNIILVSILSAGCSNFLDRIVYGGVVDYIQLSIFPVFNFADIVITVAIMLIVFSYAFNEYKEVSSSKRGPGKETGPVSSSTK